MARPSLDDGFVMIAMELHAALDVADFAKFERMVLSVLIAAQYGPKKLPGLRLDPIGLAEIAACQPSCFRKAIKSLASKGAIRPRPDGSHSIVKDWESWVRTGSDPAGDPANRRIDHGDRSFVAFVAGQFGVQNPSKNRKPRGATRHLSGATDQPLPGATQHQDSGKVGAIRHLKSGKVGAEWHQEDADGKSPKSGEANDLGISSSREADPPDPLNTREKKKSVLSTEHTDNSRVCVSDGDKQLDELRDIVAKLTEDDDLADVFRDQIGDWMTSGMTAADVRQAIMLARTKLVQPKSYVAFVTSTAKNIRNERLTAERMAKADAPEGDFALAPAARYPDRPTKAQRNAQRFEARRASMAKLFPKESPDGSR